MNKLHKKVLFISILLIVNILILILISCNSKDIYDEEAKVLLIEDIKNNNDDNLTNEINLYKVIKNVSNFSIYNILITYEEINNNNNISAKSQVFLDLTLNPNESSEISFFNDDKVKKINIVSYEYYTLDKEVKVNLKDNTVDINKSNLNLKHF